MSLKQVVWIYYGSEAEARLGGRYALQHPSILFLRYQHHYGFLSGAKAVSRRTPSFFNLNIFRSYFNRILLENADPVTDKADSLLSVPILLNYGTKMASFLSNYNTYPNIYNNPPPHRFSLKVMNLSLQVVTVFFLETLGLFFLFITRQ